MESNLVVGKNSELRKVLGSRPNKAQENKLDKLISYDSKYNYKVFNLKHVENLLNIDFLRLSPSEYIKIFKLFNKNMYYDERIYYSLYMSLHDKIPYFDFDELIKLIEYITPFAHFKGNVNEFEAKYVFTHVKDEASETQCSDIVTYDYKNSELHKIQKNIVKEITDSIENRLKFNLNIERDERFKINLTCLNSLNRLGFLTQWKARLQLSEEIVEYLFNKINSCTLLDSEKISLKETLESLNNVCDTISQKCIHTICKKIKSKEYKIIHKNEWDCINFTIVDNVELALSYYSKGDIQILMFVEDYFEKVENYLFSGLKSEELCELNLICDLCNNVSGIYNRLVQYLSNNDIIAELDSFLGIHYKTLYASKFLKFIDHKLLKNKNPMENVYTHLRESVLKLFIEHKNRLSTRNQGIIISLMCESNSSKLSISVDDKQGTASPTLKNDVDTVDVLRSIHFNLAKCGELSLLDCLNVLESSYKNFGYVNHYATKKMLDRVFKQYPKNGLEALVILRLVHFTTRLQFTAITSESKNVKMALDYMVKSEFVRTNDKNLDINKVLWSVDMLKPKSTKKGICEYDYVLRRTHNISTSKMYNRYCVSKGALNQLKRIKSIAI